MSIPIEIIVRRQALATFLIVAIDLCCLTLVDGWFLGGHAHAGPKNVPFGSGTDSVDTARLRPSAKFCLVAMLLIIFDVEALYLFVWSTSARESSQTSLVEAVIFIFMLLVGLIHLVCIGAPDWTPACSRHEHMNPETSSVANHQC